MTSQLRHKHKKPIKAQPINKIIMQNQCLTQNIHSSFHPQKFVFDDSDNDELSIRNTAQSSFFNKNNNSQMRSQRKTRRRPMSREIAGTTGTVKPSLMSNMHDRQDEYENLVKQARTTQVVHNSQPKPSSSHKNTLKTNNFVEQLIDLKTNKKPLKAQLRRFHALDFNLEDQQQEIVVNSKNQKAKEQAKQQIRQQTKGVQSQQKQQKQQRQSKSKKILKTQIVPKIQVSSLYFQMSQDQNHQEPSSTTQVNKEFQGIPKNNVKQPPSQQKQNYLHPFHQQSQQISVSEVIPDVDITNTKQNEEIARRSSYLHQFLSNNPSAQDMANAMYTPIIKGAMQIFQVHIYSTMTQKQYFLWLDMGKEMKLLMKANKSTTLSKTEFQLMSYHPQKKAYIQSAKMTSNFDRTKFIITKQQRRTGKKRLIGTITLSLSINNSKTLVLYYPKVNKNNEPTIFYKNAQDIDLQLVYRQNQIHQVDFIMTTRVDMTKKLQIMSKYQLRTSQKSMQFKDYNGGVKMIIGKKASKRYKLIVGAGLSPIQIFSMLIAQVQT